MVGMSAAKVSVKCKGDYEGKLKEKWEMNCEEVVGVWRKSGVGYRLL